jgi:hypothetical protein
MVGEIPGTQNYHALPATSVFRQTQGRDDGAGGMSALACNQVKPRTEALQAWRSRVNYPAALCEWKPASHPPKRGGTHIHAPLRTFAITESSAQSSWPAAHINPTNRVTPASHGEVESYVTLSSLPTTRLTKTVPYCRKGVNASNAVSGGNPIQTSYRNQIPGMKRERWRHVLRNGRGNPSPTSTARRKSAGSCERRTPPTGLRTRTQRARARTVRMPPSGGGWADRDLERRRDPRKTSLARVAAPLDRLSRLQMADAPSRTGHGTAWRSL